MRLLLIAQVFCVFLTAGKFIPTLRNNFGPFEVVGILLIGSFLLSHGNRLQSLKGHSILVIEALMAGLAAASLLWFQGPVLQLGVVQVFILLFQLLFVLAMFNLMLEYQISPVQLLRLVAYSALIIGPWILFAGIASQGDIQEAGPFRNRAHMSNYMLTAFWLVLLYSLWPGISKRERLISYAALASTLYPIAVAGRRSVYLSLIIGLVGLAFAFIPAYRGRRKSAFATAAVVFAVLGLLYVAGPRWLPQLQFFQERIGGISGRLEMAIGSSGDVSAYQNFFELQRTGVMMAVRDYPVFGIGWGGFHRSAYSLTGAEVHSTPLRFLAELGIVGLALYVALMGVLLIGSLRILAMLRDSVYRTPAVVLVIAIWSLSVSYLYNRHITERTFYLLLVFYLLFEAFARSLAWRQRQAAAPATGATRRRLRGRTAGPVARRHR